MTENVQPDDTTYPNRLSEIVRGTPTYKDIAVEAGRSYSFVVKIAAGQRRPDDAVKAAVEKLFNVPASWVFPEDAAP